MKRFSWIYAFLLVSVCLSAQTVTQKGVTYRYNGKNPRTPIGSVTISYDGNKRSVLSDEKSGSFSLTLENLKMGDRIGLVTVKKREMIVFNQQAVDEWSVRKEPLMLILCNADAFEKQKENLINIGRREAKKKYDKQKAELESKLNASQIKEAEYEAALDKAYEELDRLNKNIGEYADLFARIDESEVDTIAQQAVELFNKGEVEKAIQLFEQGNYMEKLDKALGTSQRADQLMVVAEQAKAQATLDSIRAIESLKAQIEAYKVNNEWQKASKLLKGLAERLNTVSDCWAYASYCHHQKDFKEAETYYKRTMELLEKHEDKGLDVFNFKKSSLLNNLAALYYDIRCYTESEMMYREAINIYRQLAEANPLVYEGYVAITLNNLAALYIKLNQYNESEALFQEALAICRRLAQATPSVYEPEVANTLNNLAFLYYNLRRYNESETMFQEALVIRKKLAQANPSACDPDVAMTLNNLANLYNNLQRFTESEEMFQEALAIRRRLAQANPSAYEPDVANTLNDLANLYNNLQRFTESEEMFQEALAIRRRLAQVYPTVYGPDVALNLHNMAYLYYILQRFNESEAMYQETLEICRRLAQDDPSFYEPYVAQSLYALGLLKIRLDQYSEAITHLEKALEIYRRIVKENPTHQKWYRDSLYWLSMIYYQQDNHIAAYRINKEWLPELKDMFEVNSDSLRYDYARKLGHQSFNALLMKDYDEAEQLAREGLKVDSAQHWIATNLAAALLFQGKYDEAEQLYRYYKDELKESFLDDFQQFEEAGVIPKEYEADVERIKKLLYE